MNPNSIKLYESSDHERHICSHSLSRWSNVGKNTGCTFALMKLAERMICGTQKKSANDESDELAVPISTEVYHHTKRTGVFVSVLHGSCLTLPVCFAKRMAGKMCEITGIFLNVS